MHYKVKTKDCHLIVKAKTSWGEEIDEKALDAFARIYLRGFLKPKLIKKNVVEYSGPVGVSLYERLKRPLSKRDFLFIMEQIVVAIQKIQSNNLALNKIVLDLHNVFINDVTKEIQFLYVPSSKEVENPGVIPFIESIVYSVQPAAENDTEYVSRFIHFLKGQNGFKPERVEKYIEREDRSVVNTIKKQNMGQSGFMTNNPKHHHEHYNIGDQNSDGGGSGHGSDVRETDLLEENRNPGSQHGRQGEYMNRNGGGCRHENRDPNATGLLHEMDYGNGDGGFRDDRTYRNGNVSRQGSFETDETGLLHENGYGVEATGLLDNGARGNGASQRRNSFETEETGLLHENGYGAEATGLGGFANEDHLVSSIAPEEGTALLNESWNVHYPVLFRIQTKEKIIINKPVFRIGKERSYVDYFVANNNAVSRSHADIISRGNKYFVIDLNSKNHTYVNDQMIAVHCETEIRDGDTLKLGNEEFTFCV